MIYFYLTLYLTTTYLVASIPFGLILGKKFAKQDVRNSGSGNIGATNVTRVAGKKIGAITLILDALKGMLMVILARFLFVDAKFLHIFLVLTAFVAVLGHIFPVYLKFKGGKGVATSIAVIIALNPIIGLLTILSWLITFLIFKVSAVSSIFSILIATILSIFMSDPLSQTVAFVTIFLLILFRHKENLSRLKSGKENKF